MSNPFTRSARSRMLLFALALAAIPAADAEDLSTSTGEQLYHRYCASCHGTSGQGDGTVAPFFRLQPPDLTMMSRRNKGVFPAERTRSIIDGRERILPHGARQMPVWGQEFDKAAGQGGSATTKAAIERIVAHLASLQK